MKDEIQRITHDVNFVALRNEHDDYLRERSGVFIRPAFNPAVTWGVVSSTIDLNMPRAKVGRHPSEWRHCGHRELIKPKERYRVVDRERLREKLDIESPIKKGNIPFEFVLL